MSFAPSAGESTCFVVRDSYWLTKLSVVDDGVSDFTGALLKADGVQLLCSRNTYGLRVALGPVLKYIQ